LLNLLALNIQYNKVNPNHGVVSITIEEADYMPMVKKQLKHYAQSLPIKGFRLGTASIEQVRKMHGQSILSEVLHNLADDALANYIKKESLPVFIESLLVESPKAEALKTQKTFAFSYEIGLIEDQNIVLGEHISVTEFQIDRVEGKLVDEFIEGACMVHGEAVEVPESTEDTLLFGTLEVGNDEAPMRLRVVVDRFPQDMRKAFVGLSIGAEVPLTKEHLATHSTALLGISFGMFDALKKADTPYVFKVQAIKQVTPAPISTKLFDLVLGEGVADTETSFREAIAKVILFDKRIQAEYAFYAEIRKVLFEHVAVSLPDAFLKKWLVAKNPEATLQEIERYYEDSKEDLKWEILLSILIRKNELTVTDSDVIEEVKRNCWDYLQKQAGIEEMAAYNDQNISKFALDFLKQKDGKNYLTLHEKLSRARAIDFIKRNIQRVVENVTAEAFDAR
jgi:trigger factor